jgi:hypothetical protein
MPSGDKWNEWSMKVLEELTNLNARQDQLAKDFERYEEASTNDKNVILDKLDDLSVLLNGNNTEPGIKTRLDRLEQSEQSRTWLLRTTIVAAIGAILSAIASWFKPH